MAVSVALGSCLLLMARKACRLDFRAQSPPELEETTDWLRHRKSQVGPVEH